MGASSLHIEPVVFLLWREAQATDTQTSSGIKQEPVAPHLAEGAKVYICPPIHPPIPARHARAEMIRALNIGRMPNMDARRALHGAQHGEHATTPTHSSQYYLHGSQSEWVTDATREAPFPSQICKTSVPSRSLLHGRASLGAIPPIHTCLDLYFSCADLLD